MTGTVKVLVVEDSRVQCALLRALLEEDPSIRVVGEAHDGLEAVDEARRLRPDVITMDIEMPRLGGLEAIDRIMVSAPSRIVVVCAVGDEHQVDLSFRAVAHGALELVAKPRENGEDPIRRWGRALRESVHLMAEVPVVRRRAAPHSPEALPSAHEPDLAAVGIVASTGGPPALAEILAGLPVDLPVPVAVAQHMAPGFVAGLVRWLRECSRLPVEIARAGLLARPGRVYLPPDGHDLLFAGSGMLRVERTTSSHCPSADRLLTSLAEVYRASAGAVVLTGMGEDGAAGVRAIREVGGVVLAQDEASSTVYGMPKAAAGAGAFIVPLSLMAPTLRRVSGVKGRIAPPPA